MPRVDAVYVLHGYEATRKSGDSVPRLLHQKYFVFRPDYAVTRSPQNAPTVEGKTVENESEVSFAFFCFCFFRVRISFLSGRKNQISLNLSVYRLITVMLKFGIPASPGSLSHPLTFLPQLSTSWPCLASQSAVCWAVLWGCAQGVGVRG